MSEVDNDVSRGHSVHTRFRAAETPVQSPPGILSSKESKLNTLLHLLLRLKMPASEVATWTQT
jgi:hypothetical protein